MIVRWQSDLGNTKEIILPVCDKPYITNKKTYQIGDWDWYVAEPCIRLPCALIKMAFNYKYIYNFKYIK